MASQRERFEDEYRPSDEELARLYRGDFGPPMEDPVDPRCALGGKSYQYFPRFESEEEESLYRDSRLDRVGWVDPDGVAARDAEELMQQREDVVVRGGGGGQKNKADNRKLFKPTRAVIAEERPLCAVVPFHVTRIMRGAMWYYRAHPQAPRSLLVQLADAIRKGEIAKTIPYKRDEVKIKTFSIVVWLPDSSIVDALRSRKRVASLFLNAAATERGGEKVAHLNSWDTMPNAFAGDGNIPYNGREELGL